MSRPTAARRQARRRARLDKRARDAEQLRARQAAAIEQLGGFPAPGELLHCPHYTGAPVPAGWLVMLPEVAVCPGCLVYLFGPSLAALLRAVAG